MNREFNTGLAIACMALLAAADLWLNPASQLPTAVVSGLLGWMSHKAVAPPPNT